MEQDYMPPEPQQPDPEPTTGPFAPIDARTPNSHIHRWEILDIWFPIEYPPHPRIKQEKQTVILIRCRTCELPQTVELQGTWTMEQVLQPGKKPIKVVRKRER